MTPEPTYLESFHGDLPSKSNLRYGQLGQTNMRVSHLSMGASAFGGVYSHANEQECCEITEMSLKNGINYIDTAPWYGQGQSEDMLGKALANIPRSTYYIATKVGRYELKADKMFDFSYEKTLQSVDESLARLGLSYVDVIQIHDLEFAPSLEIILNETLPALQKVKEAGKAKYIGITGYPLDPLKEIIERSKVKIDTILTYCRYSLNDTSLLKYKSFFMEKGIGLINASPVSMGLLTKRGPPEWHPAKHWKPDIIKACREAVEYCDARDVDISRIALHFSLADTDLTTCLISTTRKENMKRNLELIACPLNAKEQEVMTEVMEKFMVPLNDDNWEGYEVENYRKQLELSAQ